MIRSPRTILAVTAAAFALAAAVAVPVLTAGPAANPHANASADADPTAGQQVLSPNPTAVSRSAGLTSTSPRVGGSAPSGPSPARQACVTGRHAGNCGPYAYPPITNSNGYTTYVGNDMWACGPDTDRKCGPQSLTAYDPGHWFATSTQTSGNTAVLSYPNVQQVFTKASDTDPAISAFASITSDFAETMNPHAGTDAEAAYDLWLSNTSGPGEIMIWVDNVGRGSGGARRVGTAAIARQAFTVYQYGSGEIIFSLDHSEHSGTVDILAALKWLQGHGLVSGRARLGQVDFGFEICSTGGRPEKFAVSGYTLTSRCGPAGGCSH